MELVSSKYYKLLIGILSFLSVAILALSLANRFLPQTPIPPELLPEIVSAFLALLHLVMTATLLLFLHKLSFRLKTLVIYLGFVLTIIMLLYQSGGLVTLYYAIWIVLVLFSGIFGAGFVIGTQFLITTYFILLYSQQIAARGITEQAPAILLLAASYFAAVISFVFWRRHYNESTEEKRMAQLQSKLVREEIKSDTILRAIGDAIIVVDAKGIVSLMNESAEVITGWKEIDATGIDHQVVLPLFTGDDKPLKGHFEPLQFVFKQRKSVINNDVVMRTKSDRRIDLSLTISPVFDSEGKPEGAIWIFRDISAEKRAARQRDEFISTASHEMRTPIAAIEGYLALSMNEKVSRIDENARKYLGKAHNEVEHLGNLFRDLLSITKLEEGKLPNHPQVVDLGQMLNDVVEENRFQAEKKGLQINFQQMGEINTGRGMQPLFYVFADPERLREVISNLIGNAIKFTTIEEGKITATIQPADSFVNVGVHDNGIGIAPEDQQHLFQKFYRIDNTKTREIGGTGLGLYIARTIIELYNGRIWVESEPDKGSHFFFSLPRLSPEEAEKLREQGPTTGPSIPTEPPAEPPQVAAAPGTNYNSANG